MARTAGRCIAVVMAMLVPVAAGSSPSVPTALAHTLPRGYTVMAMARSRPDAAHDFTFVALAAQGERRGWGTTNAPPRPLLVYRKTAAGYRQIARNDHIVLRANEGGQCDPFEDGGITAKGRYVTIENGVACGQHWTDYITFRFDGRSGGYVFDNHRSQSWTLNSDERPGAEAMICDGDRTERANGRIVPLARWRRRD